MAISDPGSHPHSRRRAAAYVRMSTDHQELSIGFQMTAIQAYAVAQDIELVAVYEDAAKSGLEIKNRAGMKRLLRDVMDEPRPFDVVLVYDVSRWGRFQDIDAAAYYEYTCRMHGADVIYVKELFGTAQDPMTALLKTLKRAMAAEYARELGVKCRDGQDRAIQLGYQVGPLPPIGLTRVAVDRLGNRRLLGRHQHKGAQSDRVAWIHGPQWEVELVRRIFTMYADERGSIKSIARQLQFEDHRTAEGKRFTQGAVSNVLRNEAFAGNFVWGKTSAPARKKPHRETRANAVIEPIVSQELWETVHRKLCRRRFQRRDKTELLAELQQRLRENPTLSQIDLEATGLASKETYARAFGSFRVALELAGRDLQLARSHHLARIESGRAVGDLMQDDLIELFRSNGIECSSHPRSRVLLFTDGTRLRLQLCWPHRAPEGLRWHVLKKAEPRAAFVLFALMNQERRALWFSLKPMEEFRRLPPWVEELPPDAFGPVYTADELVTLARRLLV
ncbi:recombinase family protein [Hydrogenophaga crocea]|jgi:DNA invertase Pin-like site-specific DNA recombinase|uniref:Recombinase family protein n=1 Tax=Hydrogenophaga crocea TaxID=2716225 RepID=A0A6G8IK93_9BURK|nr:recombinase family protein [Hydrogenophaga crocea]QIM53503.1 recombinase family protein [Hydrogenophaga crocea]